MSNMRIRWLIGILSAAMLGLIAFQFYWMKDVIKVNEERFSQNVQGALNEVTNKLARINDISFLQRDMNRSIPYGRDRLSDIRDSAKIINRNVNNPQHSPMTQEEIFDAATFTFEFDEATGQFQISIGMQSFQADNNPADGRQPFTSPNEQRLFIEQQMGARLDEMKMSWRNHLIGSDNLFARFNPVALDTLLRTELFNRGIDLDYDYGIAQKKSNKLIYSNTERIESPEELQKSDLQANLFPMDLTPKDYFLSVYFPSQKNFLFKQALLPLSASGLLMLIIIACFAYAIMVILRQKKISEIKNDFINNMTHEFKTPIATVSLATEALQDDDLQSNKNFVDRYVQIIQEENKRLGAQVEKVLQIASLDKKDFELKFDETDVHEIILGAKANIDLIIEKRGGNITYQFLASSSTIEADKVHLTNIINNLLDNANKYSPEPPEIHVRTENISTGINIKISDNGIGMTNEATQKIFEKFFRVSTGNVHDVKGFGLGLAYVKNIVDMHQGEITVKSEVGKGSTFKVYLPFSHV
jgi:two-component system, OmpR family, phosphate regulon sensor histidine kinase PhoR